MLVAASRHLIAKMVGNGGREGEINCQDKMSSPSSFVFVQVLRVVVAGAVDVPAAAATAVVCPYSRCL